MPPRQTSPDSFQSKWTIFHPQATVWVQNVLDHDVVFQVADEHDNPYQYRLPTGKVSELPGGAVATLGVKAIVDELIQNNRNDVLRIWDREVRDRYEAEIILKVKEAPLKEQQAKSGVIDLSLDDAVAAAEEEAPPQAVAPAPGTGRNYTPEKEESFPDLKKELAKKAAKTAAAALPESTTVEE
jgi:hypothetical protein